MTEQALLRYAESFGQREMDRSLTGRQGLSVASVLVEELAGWCEAHAKLRNALMKIPNAAANPIAEVHAKKLFMGISAAEDRCIERIRRLITSEPFLLTYLVRYTVDYWSV